MKKMLSKHLTLLFMLFLSVLHFGCQEKTQEEIILSDLIAINSEKENLKFGNELLNRINNGASKAELSIYIQKSLKQGKKLNWNEEENQFSVSCETCYAPIIVTLIPLNDFTAANLKGTINWEGLFGGPGYLNPDNGLTAGTGEDPLCVGSDFTLTWAVNNGPGPFSNEEECVNFLIFVGQLSLTGPDIDINDYPGCNASGDINLIEVCAQMTTIAMGYNQVVLGTVVSCEGTCGVDIDQGNAPFGNSTPPEECDDCEEINIILQ